MADLEMAARLKWSRETCGIEAIRGNATEAARLLNVKAPTYLAHENGSRGIKKKQAKQYAAFYRVDLAWLVYGVGRARTHAA